jgi:hypothetical protein
MLTFTGMSATGTQPCFLTDLTQCKISNQRGNRVTLANVDPCVNSCVKSSPKPAIHTQDRPILKIGFYCDSISYTI